MKKIAKEFNLKGYVYRLIKRTKRVAFLEQLKDFDDGLEIVGYEIHLVRIRKAIDTLIGGKEVHFKSCEILASNNEFGTYGWTFIEKKNAEGCYHQKNKKS